MLRLTDYLDRKPRRSRAASASASPSAARSSAIPKIFLFDEPLSNLDAELRVAMRKELAALHAELGGTMIYVTHDQVEAMTLADRIVVLRAGRIEQVGTPLDLYNRPANLFVAGFIGSPRMNFLPARVSASGQIAIGSETRPVSVPSTGHAAVGADVTLGARPEHIEIVDETKADLVITVDLVEQLGGETYLYGSAPGLPQLTVRQDGQAGYARHKRLGLSSQARGFSPLRLGRKRDSHSLRLLRRQFR